MAEMQICSILATNVKFKNEALTETIQFFLDRIRVTSELTYQALISKKDPADSL